MLTPQVFQLGSHVDEQATALISKLASAADDSIARTESSLAVKLASLATDVCTAHDSGS